MEPGEGVESTKLSPLGTQRIIARRAEEATNVSPHMRNTEHVEVHDASNGVVHEPVLTVIISEPMRCVLPSRSVGA